VRQPIDVLTERFAIRWLSCKRRELLWFLERILSI